MQSVDKMNAANISTQRSVRQVLYVTARLILGAVFIYASFDKIIHPAAFAEAVYNYQILPDDLINLSAVVLPWAELLLGIVLIAGFWMPGAVALSTLLLTIFMGAMVFNFARGLDISCGCFSTSASEGPMTVWTILRNAVFLLLAVYLLFATFFPKTVYGSGHFRHEK